MKSLATLIKLQKTRVDEQRQHLAQLQDQLAAIKKQLVMLGAEMAREKIAAEKNEESRATYGAFLRAAVEKGRELENQRRTAEIAIQIARDKLAELYEEQKRYEIAEAARVEAEAAEERRLERIDLDEIGGVTYQRRKKE